MEMSEITNALSHSAKIGYNRLTARAKVNGDLWIPKENLRSILGKKARYIVEELQEMKLITVSDIFIYVKTPKQVNRAWEYTEHEHNSR